PGTSVYRRRQRYGGARTNGAIRALRCYPAPRLPDSVHNVVIGLFFALFGLVVIAAAVRFRI
ncbi:MAG: hypothetical protein ACE5E0_00170, partial [Terriglobia bacterium]